MTTLREVYRPVESATGLRHETLFVEVLVTRHGRRWSTKWSVAKHGHAWAWQLAKHSARRYERLARQIEPRPRRLRKRAWRVCEECGLPYQTQQPRLSLTCSDRCRYRRWYWRKTA